MVDPRTSSWRREQRRLDLWYEVPLVPQTTGMSCWAASAAMIVGWRESIPVDPSEVARGVGRWSAFQEGLQPADIGQLCQAWNLVAAADVELAELRMLAAALEQHGPLWVGEASPGLHSIVVVGLESDGTEAGTLVRINDPWPVDRGERYVLPFAEFHENFRAATDVVGRHIQVLHAGGRRRGTSRTHRSVERREVHSAIYSFPTRDSSEEIAMKRYANHPDDYSHSSNYGFGAPASAFQAVASDPALSEAARTWLATGDFEERMSVLDEVGTWVHALDRSALELMGSVDTREHFLTQVDWSTVHFKGRGRNSAESESLFKKMTAVVPERRVPHSIEYHDVTEEVVPVPGTTRKLYPEASTSFVQLREAAAAEGVELKLLSAWRSPAHQQRLRKKNSNPAAVAQGVSAHTYGLAVDLALAVGGLSLREASTRSMENIVKMYRSPVYKWMALKGREFGWFPYRREPWHWEYNPEGFKERYEVTMSGAQGYGAPYGLLQHYARPELVAEAPYDQPGQAAFQASPLQQAATDWCQIRHNAIRSAVEVQGDWLIPGTNDLREENDMAVRPMLEMFWRDGAGPAWGDPVVRAQHSAQGSGSMHPWSAAFISWVMRNAGVPANAGFEFSGRHMDYIAGAMRNRENGNAQRPFWLRDISEQPNVIARPGDIICFNRPVDGVMTTHSYASVKKLFWGKNGEKQNVQPSGNSHCDVAVGYNDRGGQRFLECIGGNKNPPMPGLGRNNRGTVGDVEILVDAQGVIPAAEIAAKNIFAIVKLTECDRDM